MPKITTDERSAVNQANVAMREAIAQFDFVLEHTAHLREEAINGIVGEMTNRVTDRIDVLRREWGFDSLLAEREPMPNCRNCGHPA